MKNHACSLVHALLPRIGEKVLPIKISDNASLGTSLYENNKLRSTEIGDVTLACE